MAMRKPNNQIEIKAVLMGGIGNQLFQYSHAYSIAQRLDASLYLDLRGVPSRGQQKGSMITDLQIPYAGKVEGNKVLNYLWKIPMLRSLSSSPSPVSDFVLGVNREPFSKISIRRRVSVASFSIESGALGVFPGNLPLELSRGPSEDLLDEYQLAGSEGTVVVHHRLGDSLKLKNSRGQLGEAYFAKAMSKIIESGVEINRVRVYSDDTHLSKVLLSQWLSGFELSWIELDLTAAELLTALARARHLVLSNSTMSWWAGAGGTHETVVAPSEWDKSGSSNLNLTNWLTSEPDWT